jgi:hypothetical protein
VADGRDVTILLAPYLGLVEDKVESHRELNDAQAASKPQENTRFQSVEHQHSKCALFGRKRPADWVRDGVQADPRECGSNRRLRSGHLPGTQVATGLGHLVDQVGTKLLANLRQSVHRNHVSASPEGSEEKVAGEAGKTSPAGAGRWSGSSGGRGSLWCPAAASPAGQVRC